MSHKNIRISIVLKIFIRIFKCYNKIIKILGNCKLKKKVKIAKIVQEKNVSIMKIFNDIFFF